MLSISVSSQRLAREVCGPLQTADLDMKFSRKPSPHNFKVEFTGNHFACKILLIDLLQLHVEGFEFFLSVVECWGVHHEYNQSYYRTKLLQSQKTDSGRQRFTRIDTRGRERDDEDTNVTWSSTRPQLLSKNHSPFTLSSSLAQPDHVITNLFGVHVVTYERGSYRKTGEFLMSRSTHAQRKEHLILQLRKDESTKSTWPTTYSETRQKKTGTMGSFQ